MGGSSAMGQASPREVTRAQTLLKQKGLYNGPINGQFTAATRDAVSQFQKQSGLKQTAQLDEDTLSNLQAGATTGGLGARNNDAGTPSNSATPPGSLGTGGGTTSPAPGGSAMPPH